MLALNVRNAKDGVIKKIIALVKYVKNVTVKAIPETFVINALNVDCLVITKNIANTYLALHVVLT